MYWGLLLLSFLAAGSQAAGTRQVFDVDSPAWLEAVGVVHNEFVWQDKPGELQQCTASLVASNINTDSMILATVGHCVQGWVQRSRDASGRLLEPAQYEYDKCRSPMKVQFRKRDGTSVQVLVAEVLAERYGRGDGADYAVLRLVALVPSELIQPLVVSELPFAANSRSNYGLLEFELRHLSDRRTIRRAYLEVADLSPQQYREKYGRIKPFGTVAGYSADSDPALGDGGKNLTYDDHCDFVDGHRDLETVVWCSAYPGASGGPFVITMDRGNNLEHLLVGVLSGGRGVIPGQLRMIPVDTPDFYAALTEAFEKHHKVEE